MGEGRENIVVSFVQSCIMLKKVFPEIKLLRFIEKFIFPDQSKLMRIFLF